MSRTEGISLPRLPTTYTRLTSPQSIKVHPAVTRPQGTAGGGWTGRDEKGREAGNQHRRSISEPYYTAYVGTPRQDIPYHVYRDAAMFDDVFEKQGRLFQSRDTPKIANPLNSLGYSSLHDPHCRKLFLNNKRLRSHLMDLGLITDDLKVVASTHEQRQRIRAHELLERKETIFYKLETQEKMRIKRLQRQTVQLPLVYKESLLNSEERRMRVDKIQKSKIDNAIHAEQQKKMVMEEKRRQEKRKLKQVMEETHLYEQAKRNAARYQQECAELAAYEKQYGKFGRQLAYWHRDSDRIHNRMVFMHQKYWSNRKDSWLSQSYPPAIGPIASGAITTTETTAVPLAQENKSCTQEDAQPNTADITQPEDLFQTPLENVVEESLKQLSIDDGRNATEISEKPTLDTHDVMLHEPAILVDVNEESNDTNIDNVAKDDKNVVNVLTPPTIPNQEMVLLDRVQSDTHLTKILIDLLHRIDYSNHGFVTVDDFTQVINSRDLGLQLNENELINIAKQSNIYGNGWVPFVQVVPRLPDWLFAAYRQRAELATQQYGAYFEEKWCQIYHPDNGVCYYNKLTGEVQVGGRPDDFRPFLKEDPFEESVVDFFETADSDKDGVIDINNLYALLISPMVSTRIYNNQMEVLLNLFEEQSSEGLLHLEGFSPIANTLLLMIYQNAYPDVDEWIELDSRKFGTFFFNKVSGETYIPASTQETLAQPEDSDNDGPIVKKRKKKKRSKYHRNSLPPVSKNADQGTNKTAPQLDSTPGPQKQEGDQNRPPEGVSDRDNQEPKSISSAGKLSLDVPEQADITPLNEANTNTTSTDVGQHISSAAFQGDPAGIGAATTNQSGSEPTGSLALDDSIPKVSTAKQVTTDSRSSNEPEGNIESEVIKKTDAAVELKPKASGDNGTNAISEPESRPVGTQVEENK